VASDDWGDRAVYSLGKEKMATARLSMSDAEGSRRVHEAGS